MTMHAAARRAAQARRRRSPYRPGSGEHHAHDAGAGARSTSRSASARSLNVGDVYYGTIEIAGLPRSRRRARGAATAATRSQDIKFTMTMPKNPRTGPMPVVIFGHGLVTERRFVLARRRRARREGLRRDLDRLPVPRRSHVLREGRPDLRRRPDRRQPRVARAVSVGHDLQRRRQVRRRAGQRQPPRDVRRLDLPVASGAMFLEIEHIANTKDHFQQALVDLGALDRSLRIGDWQP